MEKCFATVLCLTAVFFISVSCNSTGVQYTGVLEALPGTVDFSGEDNRFDDKRKTVAIDGNDREYKVSCEYEWIDIKENGAFISIGVLQNDSGEPRSGSVRIVSHLKKPVEITVNQLPRVIKEYDWFTGTFSFSADIKKPYAEEHAKVEWISDITVSDRGDRTYVINGFGSEGIALNAKYDNGFFIIELNEECETEECTDCRIMGVAVYRDYFVVKDVNGLTGRYDSDINEVRFRSYGEDISIGVIDIKNDRRYTNLYGNIVMKKM